MSDLNRTEQIRDVDNSIEQAYEIKELLSKYKVD